MKFLFVSQHGDTADLAFRCKKEGNDVQFYVRKKQWKKVYDGILNKPDHWGHVLEKDRVIVFDMVGGGETADRLRKQGFKVFGGSLAADFLELNRSGGTKVAKKVGVKIPETKEFKDFASAIKFVKTKEGQTWERAVFKPHGNMPTSMTASPYTMDQMERYLCWVEGSAWPKDKPVDFELQRFVKGIEVSCEDFFNGKSFINQPNFTFEEKKAWDNGKGPTIGCAGNIVKALEPTKKLYLETVKKMESYLANPRIINEQGKEETVLPYVGPIDINSIITEEGPQFLEFCYSSDTEVLTKDGWTPMVTVGVGQQVAGLNDEGELIYVSVEDKTLIPWNEDVIHFKSNDVYDLIVTPNHRMVFQTEKGKLYFKPAYLVSGHGEKTKRTAKWLGLDKPIYTIPGYTENHFLGKHGKYAPLEHFPVDVDMESWCCFLGLFLAEGSLHFSDTDTPYQVNISQFKNLLKCRETLDNLGIKYTQNKSGFTINSTQLCRHLFALIGPTKAPEKRLPRFVLELSPKYIEAFLKGFFVGDGNLNKGQRTFFTTSKGLADDIGECLLRVGNWYRIRVQQPTKSSLGTNPIYCVGERTTKKDGVLLPGRHQHKEQYNGFVTCLKVPYHRLYVRRPGGPSMWCGNTARFGYDAIFALVRMMKIEVGKFISDVTQGLVPDLALGKECGMTIRLSIPPYPAPVNGELEGYPIDLPKQYKPNYHLSDVMVDKEGRLCCAGSDGIICVLGEVGKDVKKVAEKLYGIAGEVKVPELQFRGDIEKRYLTEVPVLEKQNYV